MLEHIKKNKREYIIICLLILLFSIIFVGNRYASDTYFLEAYGYKNNAFDPYFEAGRFVMTGYLGLMGIINMPFETMKIITFVLANIFLIISTALIYKTIDKHSNTTKTLKVIISFMLIFSLFVTEYFYFTEYTAVVTLGILLSTVATYYLLKFISEKNKKHILISCMAAFVSSFCYQGTYSLLVLLPITYVLMYSKSIKQFLYNNGIIAIIYAIPSIVTLILTKVFENSRVKSDGGILDGIFAIIEGTKNLLVNTHNLLPRGFYLIIFLLISGITIFLILKNKKDKIKKFGFLLYIIMAVFIVTLAPSLLTTDVWLMPRSNLGLALLIPVVSLFIVLYLKNSKKIQVLLTGILCLFLIFQLHGTVSFGIMQYKNNALTNYEMTQIANEINLYEQNNNLKIQKISLYKGEVTYYSYDSITAIGDNNLRPLSIGWAVEPVFQKYFKDNYIYIEMNEENKEKCKEKLNENSKQNYLYFEEDIVNICIY